MGALAFLADGHSPGRGKYGQNVERALNYVLTHAKPTGLLNMADAQRDMYNHGLSTFVLGQAYGMTSDTRIGGVLERALKLIANTQCHDGGWDYQASVQDNGHDLSLAVMQAKALRSAVDSGFEVPPEVIKLAIKDVREHYSSRGGQQNENDQQREPGQFTYMKGGGNPTLAMAAAGVVCLQEFGQYDDWRIAKNMEIIGAHVQQLNKTPNRDGRPGLPRRSVHDLLRRPGDVPSRRHALEEGLSRPSRPSDRLPSPRRPATSIKTAAGTTRNTSAAAAGRSLCTRRLAASRSPSRTDICRSSRRGRLSNIS